MEHNIWGFTVPQVTEKQVCPVDPEDRTGGWTEPAVWSLALEGKDDLARFKALNWGLWAWDVWNSNAFRIHDRKLNLISGMSTI